MWVIYIDGCYWANSYFVPVIAKMRVSDSFWMVPGTIPIGGGHE